LGGDEAGVGVGPVPLVADLQIGADGGAGFAERVVVAAFGEGGAVGGERGDDVAVGVVEGDPVTGTGTSADQGAVRGARSSSG